MTKQKALLFLRNILLGKRYKKIRRVEEQIKFLAMSYIFMAALVPLAILGFTALKITPVEAAVNFTLALVFLLSLVLMRTQAPLQKLAILPVTAYGAYCIYFLFFGIESFWITLLIFTFPLISIYLCNITIGLIQTVAVLAIGLIFMYSPYAPEFSSNSIRLPFVCTYILITGLTVIYERTIIKKESKEEYIKNRLSGEMAILNAMKDNLPQAVFLIDRNLKILPHYSKTLVSILSHYDYELAGKNLLDLLDSSFDFKQLQLMKDYFEMLFDKTKDATIMENINPLGEFVYRTEDGKKFLSTNFRLLDEEGFENVLIGVIQDITSEKLLEKKIHEKQEALEQEKKDMFNILQIDPLVFQDFIEEAESNFNYINYILKDRTISEKQVIEKFFSNIHAIHSNAAILGMESFTEKLYVLENYTRALMAGDIGNDSIILLAVKLEELMRERDNYLKIVKKIEAFKNSNQVDTILINTMNKAAENTAAEVKKKVVLKPGHVDMDILKTGLRKPIKDILFHCIRNSIYNNLETVDERKDINKKPQGVLEFHIKNENGNAEILFSDDGQGLDYNRLKKVYANNHPEIRNPSRKNILSFIFAPEYSNDGENDIGSELENGLILIKDLVKKNNGTIHLDPSDSGVKLVITLPIPKSVW